MEFNRCYGCMEEITAYPCPHCGYTPGGTGPDYALRPGSILYGKYLVGKILGQGGFGITYIGWDLMLERKVAVKEYYPSGQVVRQPGTSTLQWYGTEQATNARESGKDMFLKEARKMNKVRKIPQVVQVLDLFQENDTAYIVMDFIEGETLTRRLRKTGPLSWHQMQEIFLPVIQAMEEVHKAGLIHRDLSPDNLMLQPDGGVQILDLGAAKDLSLNSGASSMQVAKGGFSPLEQYHQRGGSGTWTDVYALAATIYYALTGTVPPTAVERMDEDTLRWDHPRLQGLPPKGVGALKKAMAIRSKDRTQTMEELYRGIAVPEVNKPEKKEKKAAKEKPAPAKTEPAKTIPEAAVTGKTETTQAEKVEKKRKNLLLPIGAVVVCAVIAVALLWKPVIRPNLDYRTAIRQMEAGQYAEAIAAFEAFEGYKDSAQRIEDCEAGILEQRYEAAVSLMEQGNYAEALSILESLDGYPDRAAILELRYQAAVSLMEQGNYTEAIAAFAALEDYKDSPEKQEETIRMSDYAAAEELLAGGETGKAAIAFGKLSGYKDSRERSFALWEEIAHRETVSAGYYHTVGLKADGTVVAVGSNNFGQRNVSNWTDIVAVGAGVQHTVGLKADGTVVAVGWNEHGQCNVSDWTDIVAVSAGGYHTVGLKTDGTVVAVGDNEDGQCDVTDWRDIVAVSAGWFHTVGLKADGTVVATEITGRNAQRDDYGQCDVADWQDIVAVSAGANHTVGLKADGTVVAVGYNWGGQCDVTDWQDIVAVSAGGWHTVGLKADGSVVAVGSYVNGQYKVSYWQDIVAVSAGSGLTVGLKADGTVVAVGNNLDGQCNISGWTNIKLPK